MRPLDLTILVIASFADLSIGLLSYLKNYRNLTHKLFAVLTVTLVGWTSANYISITSQTPAHIFLAIKAILLFVVMQNMFFFIFISTYPGNVVHLKKTILKRYVIFSLFTVALGIFPGFFKTYVVSGSTINPEPSPFIVFFIAHTIISISGGIGKLIQRYIHSHGLSRNRFQFLLLASAVLLLIAPITNFIFPVAFNNNFFIPFGPLYTLAFAGLIAYSMFRYQLLDFRALVAKAFAYFLTVGFIALFYTTIIFGVFSLFLGTQNINASTRAIYTLLAVVLAFSFQSIKQFFDRVTNKFFYKDTYDTQTFLNELNSILVSTIELEILLRSSSQVIEDNLKPEFTVFSINKTDSTDNIIVGSNQHNLAENDILHIKNLLLTVREKIIITDDLEGTYASVKSFLNRKNIAVVVRLTPHIESTDEVGYLILGHKKSGSPYDNQDIRNLGIIADELVIAIQNALRFEEIQTFNATLQQKINNATHKLQKTNEKLQALDEAKDEFISMASHQLRTPLTAVKGYISMVLEGDAGKITANQKQLLDQAFTSSQRMVYLISDLLNVSRLKTGKFVIEATPSNLADVVEGEMSQLYETAKARKLELTYKKPKDFPTLMLDETKIRQVIMNFADNAIYYTPAGGHIHVELEDKGETVEFRVVDDGLGVPKSEQHHLFTKFYRAGNARKARPDGTGLGLFMARKVVAAQGGSIIFRSQEGKGSTFGFTFAKDKLKLKN